MNESTCNAAAYTMRICDLPTLRTRNAGRSDVGWNRRGSAASSFQMYAMATLAPAVVMWVVKNTTLVTINARSETTLLFLW
jgi:hypothetical protein